MTRKVIPRLLAAGGTLAALTAAVTLFAGSSFAQGSSAAQANYQPKSTAAPTISGTAEVGKTLTTTNGSWDSDSSITSYTYQWYRCNEAGNNCNAIDGATKQTYVVQALDGGDTLEVTVRAHNTDGSNPATSMPTSVVPVVATVPAPKNTSAPTISGTPQVGQTLTASAGSWTYQSTPTYTYQWLRCDSNGNSCSNDGGASSSNAYTVQSSDSGHRLRVTVTAHNAEGTASATSGSTDAVSTPPPSGPQGAIKLGNGKTSIPASSVVLPARLVIDGVAYQPRVVRGHGPFIARFHVSDTRGYVVRDALVYALGIPYAWVTKGAEVRTDQNGWATITITPSKKMPNRGALLVFVRARVDGQDVLAGSSTRRLSQILIR
jgi:Ig domain of plant-specific actin-binding protein